MQTASQVENKFLFVTGQRISLKTVAKRLQKREIYAHRSVVFVTLQKVHHGARLQWCRQHCNCSKNNCFQTRIDSVSHLFVLDNGFGVKRSSAYRPQNIHERGQYDTCSIDPIVMLRIPFQTGTTVNSRQWGTHNRPSEVQSYLVQTPKYIFGISTYL